MERKQVRPKLFSADDAAELLGVSSKRVRILINEGRIVAQFVGKTWVIFKDDLDEFKQTRNTKSGRPKKK